MNRILSLSLSVTSVFLFIAFANIQTAEATANVCYCHTTPSTPSTHCTSDSALQNGHTGHGDVPFGCECGDGICDPEFEEDCGTCPADCAPELGCDTCGDGIIDEGEECGEDTLECDTGSCVGCRCLDTCGDGVVDTGEQCDGDECCNPDCTLIDSEECGGTDGGGDTSGDATAGDGSDGDDTSLTPAGGQDVAGQTGGNGFGCSRDYETTTTSSSMSPRDASANFALLLLPGLFILLRRRK